MTREEIMAMAREAGLQTERLNQYPAELWEIVRFAALVAAKEREACAHVCESEWSNVAERMYGRECAASIRARGQA